MSKLSKEELLDIRDYLNCCVHGSRRSYEPTDRERRLHSKYAGISVGLVLLEHIAGTEAQLEAVTKELREWKTGAGVLNQLKENQELRAECAGLRGTLEDLLPFPHATDYKSIALRQKIELALSSSSGKEQLEAVKLAVRNIEKYHCLCRVEKGNCPHEELKEVLKTAFFLGE